MNDAHPRARLSERTGDARVRVEMLARPPRVVVVPAPMAESPTPLSSEIDRVWNALCADNPALYDGPIVRVESFDAERGEVVCSRSSFKHLATADRLGLSTRQLGIVGWITGRDRQGREHVLLGRRGSDTRVYQGLWENAPSGGVSPRLLAAPPRETAIDVLFEALREEAEEELAMTLASWTEVSRSGASVRRWIVDDLAHSLDLVAEIDLGNIDPTRIDQCGSAGGVAGGACARSRPDGEYLDAGWVARDEWSRFATSSPRDVLSPPTLALAASLGWELRQKRD